SHSRGGLQGLLPTLYLPSPLRGGVGGGGALAQTSRSWLHPTSASCPRLDAQPCPSKGRADELAPSKRARHLGEVLRPVGIQAAAAGGGLDGRVGWNQHRDRIADRMIVADPRQRALWASGEEHRLVGVAEIARQLVDRGR